MLNKSHRSVVSTCALIFMPYLKKKTIKNSLKKHFFFFAKKNTIRKKTVFFFCITRYECIKLSCTQTCVNVFACIVLMLLLFACMGLVSQAVRTKEAGSVEWHGSAWRTGVLWRDLVGQCGHPLQVLFLSRTQKSASFCVGWFKFFVVISWDLRAQARFWRARGRWTATAGRGKCPTMWSLCPSYSGGGRGCCRWVHLYMHVLSSSYWEFCTSILITFIL